MTLPICVITAAVGSDLCCATYPPRSSVFCCCISSNSSSITQLNTIPYRRYCRCANDSLPQYPSIHQPTTRDDDELRIWG
ncbi:hypothetical protein F4782DRAFT_274393 [Xylaria castorea]|nr:hypothetical protein F4782DRAFT_274393 [Xylaria castorea]